MAIIVHITKRDAWTEAQTLGIYRTASLDTGGFIHCSRPDQAIAVANFIFHGQSDLVILGIDEAKVVAEIRHENLDGGDKLFPHIYGPLNLDAVTQVVDFGPLPDGTFELPEAFREKTV
jgi:uncharacterized protein (DUF952 family)